MGHNYNGVLVALLIAMGLVGAGLIWTVPSFFDASRPSQTWPFIGLSGLFVLLVIAAGRQRGRLDQSDDE